MSITCFIEYKIVAHKSEQFKEYAKQWGQIIPACGGNLIGYFVPHEGTNDTAFGLINFDSLADYEQYRIRLKRDGEANKNFAFANEERFIIKGNRTFLKCVPETAQQLNKRLL